MAPAVSIAHLKKSYGTIEAVRDVSLTIESGEIFGLLGPNGAGKTTTIRCLCTLANPDSGTITVSGIDAIANPRAVRNRLGYVAQEVALDKILTGREMLELQAALYHLPRKMIPERIERATQLLGLDDYIDRKTGGYSGGMRRRLDLAAGLLHQPDVLVLDEPTVGLDIDSRLTVWNFLRQLRDEGTTIVLTSHYLEEIDALADRVAIIDRGTIIASGTPDELKATIGGDRVTLRIREFTSDEEVKTAQSVLADLAFVSDIVVNAAQGNSLNLVVAGQDNALLSIQEALRDRGLPTFSIAQARPSLDDVYLAATGKTLMDAELAAAGTRDLKQEKKQEMAGK